jgi:hypothetical protein
MTDPPPVSDRPPDRAEPRGRALHAAAFGLLLAVVAARCFLGELPFTTSTLQFVPRGATARSRPAPGGAGHGAAGRDEADGRDATYRADTNDLARMTFAVLLLATVALWLAGGALAGRLAVRHGYLAILIVVFAVLSLASGFLASNKREALNGWVEQVSLLAACFLAIQLCTSRRRFVLLAAVLAGVGAALAVKGLSQYFVEIPEHVRDFQAHRVERLRAFGWEPDTPQARLVEGRLRSQAITGFGPLANPFASLLLVLLFAGAGLGIDKLRAALASRRSRPAGRRKGDVDLPILAAALTLAAAVPVGLAVVLTRSRWLRWASSRRARPAWSPTAWPPTACPRGR